MSSDAVLPPDPHAIDAATEQALRTAAGELGVAGLVDVETAPPPALRARVLAAARARRAPAGRTELSAVELHRIELSRSITALRHLTTDRWDHRLDPPELAGWTVHDAVVHLAANEALLAQALGVALPAVPETETANEPRTALAIARLRGQPPARALDELEEAAATVDAHVSGLSPDQLAGTVEFWGQTMSLARNLYARTFETWTHTDDVRRAVGAPEAPPPPPVMHQLCRAAVAVVPHLLRARGVEPPARLVRFHLDGPGGAVWDLALPHGVVGPAGDAEPDAELSIGTVDLCRGISARVPRGGLPYTSRGDTALAERIIESLPALAAV
jgi:uncharacterized protein (TIGR03083 family)